jgi:hypothetical protein
MENGGRYEENHKPYKYKGPVLTERIFLNAVYGVLEEGRNSCDDVGVIVHLDSEKAYFSSWVYRFGKVPIVRMLYRTFFPFFLFNFILAFFFLR